MPKDHPPRRSSHHNPGTEAESECSFSSCSFARRCTEDVSTSSRSSSCHVGAVVPEGVAFPALPAVDERVRDHGVRRDPGGRRAGRAVPRGARSHHRAEPPPGDRRHQRAPQRQARARSATRTRASSGPGPPCPASATRSTRGSSAAPARSSCSSTATRSGPKERCTELVKPFANRKVGGVTTNQRIVDYDRNILTRWADWLESIRVQYSMPAMSVLGQVGCLPGRTIAFRRFILDDAMPGVPQRALPRRLPRGERRPDAHEPVPEAGLPDRLPVDELRLHRRARRHAQAGEAAAAVGARQPVQHAADAALDDAQHADARALLRLRHRDAVPVARGRDRVHLPGRSTARTSTSTRASRSGTGRSSAPRSSSSSRCWRPGSRRTCARAGTSTSGRATCCSCRSSRCSTRSCSCPSASTASCGWPRTTVGAPAQRFDGDAARREPNPYAAIPYVLAFTFVLIGVAYHG